MAFGFGFGGLAVKTDVMASALGGLTGAAQTFALRELVDTAQAKSFLSGTGKTPPFLMKALGNFGSPSVMIGIGAGLVGLVVGYYMLKKQSNVVAGSFLLSYGLVALGTGILSGFLPTASWNSAVAVDPGNPVRIAGKHGITIRPGVAGASALAPNASGIGTI